MSSDSQTEYEGELNQWDEVIPGIALMASNGEERTAWFDGIQLEEAPGARVLPGQFSDPDKQISDDFARALSAVIFSSFAPWTGAHPEAPP